MGQMKAGLGSPPLGGPQRRILDREKLNFASLFVGGGFLPLGHVDIDSGSTG